MIMTPIALIFFGAHFLLSSFISGSFLLGSVGVAMALAGSAWLKLILGAKGKEMARYYEVGGYPTMRIELDYDSGGMFVYKRHLDPCKASHLARSVWKNNQPIKRVRVVNEKTGFTRDTISRVPREIE